MPTPKSRHRSKAPNQDGSNFRFSGSRCKKNLAIAFSHTGYLLTPKQMATQFSAHTMILLSTAGLSHSNLSVHPNPALHSATI